MLWDDGMKYTPNDDPIEVYKNINLNRKNFRVAKLINGTWEDFGTFENLVDAVHERDQLEKVEWDIDALVEIPLTKPDFSIDDLPAFPYKRKGNKYFGFKGTQYCKGHFNENKFNRVWDARIKYNNHSTHLNYYHDPLTANLIYKLVKEEVQRVKV